MFINLTKIKKILILAFGALSISSFCAATIFEKPSTAFKNARPILEEKEIKAEFNKAVKLYSQLSDKKIKSAGSWKNILDSFENIIANLPNSEEAVTSRLQKARVLNRLFEITKDNNYKTQSIQAYQNLISLFPISQQSDTAKLELAQSYINSKNWQMAQNLYQGINLKKLSSESLSAVNANLANIAKNLIISPKTTELINAESLKLDDKSRIVLSFNGDFDFQQDEKKEKITIVNSKLNKKTIGDSNLFSAIESKNNIIITPNKNLTLDVFAFNDNEKHSLVIDYKINPEATDSAKVVSLKNDAVTAQAADAEVLKVPKINSDLTFTSALGLKVKRIVIDPGHGGKDPGAIGFGEYEKNIALRLSKLLAEKLKSYYPNLDVILTRDSDRYLTLEERSQFAIDHKADLFISMHCNANEDKTKFGFESYYLSYNNDQDALSVAYKENYNSKLSINDMSRLIKNLVSNNKAEDSMKLADSVQKSISQSLKLAGYKYKDLGVKKAPFLVLIGTNIPSILIESGFITNKNELNLLQDPKYSENLISGIAYGLGKYISWHQSQVAKN